MIKHYFKLLIVLSLVFSFLLATPVSAAANSLQLNDVTLDFFNVNGIYYYNPLGSDSCFMPIGSYDGSTTAGLTATQAAFVDTYHDIAAQLSVEYGIPWEAVMAQGILESAAGTSKYARERNNFFGIGAVDSNPDNAAYFDTPAEGWKGYYEFIRTNSRYRNHGVFREPTITNPYAYIQAIKNAGYATDPNYVAKVSSLIDAVINRALSKGWMLSIELAEAHPEMYDNAAKNASSSTSTPGASDISYTGTVCVPKSGGNGDINSTAISLAWPDHTHDKSDPKPEYIAAQKAVGLWGSQDASNCSIYIGAACDRFVATVILYSGVDPQFPQGGGVATLMNYLASSSLYQEVPNTGNTSDLQPGDILAKSASGGTRGHVQIFVQKPDGSYAIASASYCDRTAELSNISSVSSEYKIYRYIGKTV